MRSRGFTLIELVVTVAIVGVLASAALPLAELTFRRTREQDLRMALRELRTGIDAYKAAVDQGRIMTEVGASGYPPSLDALVTGVEDARNPDGAKLYFLRRVPRDPFFPDTAAAPASTWGLRSYESPPEEPRRGEDVFDVYSLSASTGINGVPYREW
jgi:general secretion pathway protein G